MDFTATSKIIITITSTSDLQPSTTIANQLPGQYSHIYWGNKYIVT